jgi:hypothetical protein
LERDLIWHIEIRIYVSMLTFKRNQIEEAISHMFDPHATKPSVELRTRLQRLLETDRNFGRSPRSADPEKANFAFFSREAPGSGVEVWFSVYEAFALFTAWRLLEHGWPQTSAVSVLRQVRPSLEREHAKILKMDRQRIFDEQRIRAMAGPGALAVSTTHPVFLVVATIQGLAGGSHAAPRTIEICHGEMELMPVIRREAGQLSTILELVAPAHMLLKQLEKTKPSKRGRGSE